MYTQLSTFAEQFSTTQPAKAVDGEYYDMPGTTVYHTATLKLPDKGRIEVNRLTPEAPETFEWQYEITIDDRSAGTYVHLLLRRDGTLVETYGKTVLVVDEPRAQALYEQLQLLSQTA